MPEPPTPRPRRAPAAGIVVAAGAALLAAILALAMGRPQFGTGEQSAGPGGNMPPPEAATPAANAPSTPPAANSAAEPSRTPPPAPHVSNGPAAQAPPASPPKVDPNELPPGHPEIPTASGPQLSLQWLGHSCFYLYSPGGATAVTDPFDPKATGLPAPSTGAHVVTVSAGGPDHSFTAVVHGFPGESREVVRGRGAQLKDLKVTPVETEPGHFAYVFETAGLRIAHLGDLTRPLSGDRLKQLGKVDILLVPAGGEGISPKDAAAITKAIAPRVVIPMAYSTAAMEGPDAKLRPLDAFVSATPYAVTNKDLDTILIGPADLPSSTEIYTLKLRRE